jgi:hypothetical protein
VFPVDELLVEPDDSLETGGVRRELALALAAGGQT